MNKMDISLLFDFFKFFNYFQITLYLFVLYIFVLNLYCDVSYWTWLYLFQRLSRILALVCGLCLNYLVNGYSRQIINVLYVYFTFKYDKIINKIWNLALHFYFI